MQYFSGILMTLVYELRLTYVWRIDWMWILVTACDWFWAVWCRKCDSIEDWLTCNSLVVRRTENSCKWPALDRCFEKLIAYDWMFLDDVLEFGFDHVLISNGGGRCAFRMLICAGQEVDIVVFFEDVSLICLCRCSELFVTYLDAIVM